MIYRSTDPRRPAKPAALQGESEGMMPDAMVYAVKGLKVTTILSGAALAGAALVPPEPAPAGQPMVTIEVEGGMVVHALLNGKSVRKCLKAIAEHGPDGVNCILQGNLKAGAEPGSWILDAAGLTAAPRVVKEPKGEAVA